MIVVSSVVERPLAAIARPLVLTFSGVERTALESAWRAAAIQRAARLRSAYRDLDSRDVPGHDACADLHARLGVEAKTRRAGADVWISRALRAANGFEPDRGVELEQALALELVAPLCVGWLDGLPENIAIRFGRDGEKLGFDTKNGVREHVSLRGRAVVCVDESPWATPGSSWGARVVPPGRDAVLVVFLSPGACDDSRIDRVTAAAEATFRSRAWSVGLAQVTAPAHG